MKKVTAALLVKDNKILIAQRKAKDSLAYKWEFPGGKIEVGETPEECLKREIKEEFNLDIDVKDFFGSSKYDYYHGSIELLAFWASCKGGIINSTVHEAYKWISIDEIGNYDFAPADRPFVEKLKRDLISLE